MQLSSWGVASPSQPGQQVATNCAAGTIIYMAGRDQVCPQGYVAVRNTGGAIGVPWKTECQCIGVAPAPAAPPPAPPPAPTHVTTTVSPNIQVSPQISPVFQQQFQPQNSPATAGTSQNLPTSQGATVQPPPQPIIPQAPVYIAAPAPAPAQPPAMPPIYSGGGGSYIEPATPIPATDQGDENRLPPWLPWVLGFGAVGTLLLLNQQRKR